MNRKVGIKSFRSKKIFFCISKIKKHREKWTIADSKHTGWSKKFKNTKRRTQDRQFKIQTHRKNNPRQTEKHRQLNKQTDKNTQLAQHTHRQKKAETVQHKDKLKSKEGRHKDKHKNTEVQHTDRQEIQLFNRQTDWNTQTTQHRRTVNTNSSACT